MKDKYFIISLSLFLILITNIIFGVNVNDIINEGVSSIVKEGENYFFKKEINENSKLQELNNIKSSYQQEIDFLQEKINKIDLIIQELQN